MRAQRLEGDDDIEAFAAWVVKDVRECMNFSYADYVTKFKNVDWGSLANVQMRYLRLIYPSVIHWFN